MFKKLDILDEKDKRLREISVDAEFPLSKDEKKFLLSINPRILENNMNSKEKLKRVFPNLSIYNKNL